MIVWRRRRWRWQFARWWRRWRRWQLSSRDAKICRWQSAGWKWQLVRWRRQSTIGDTEMQRRRFVEMIVYKSKMTVRIWRWQSTKRRCQTMETPLRRIRMGGRIFFFNFFLKLVFKDVFASQMCLSTCKNKRNTLQPTQNTTNIRSLAFMTKIVDISQISIKTHKKWL